MTEIRRLDDATEITAEVLRFRSNPDAEPFLCDTRRSLLAFCACVFPNVGEDSLYAQKFKRSPLGRGLHFDVFDQLLSPTTPWIGIFNLTGRCSVRLFALPDHLARLYFQQHPTPSDRAYQARREISQAAMDGLTESPAVGILEPRTGFVLPQMRDGVQWVHEVVPCDPADPGEFIKFAVAASPSALLIANGYEAPAEWFEEGIGTPDRIDGGAAAGPPFRPRRCNLD